MGNRRSCLLWPPSKVLAAVSLISSARKPMSTWTRGFYFLPFVPSYPFHRFYSFLLRALSLSLFFLFTVFLFFIIDLVIVFSIGICILVLMICLLAVNSEDKRGRKWIFFFFLFGCVGSKKERPLVLVKPNLCSRLYSVDLYIYIYFFFSWTNGY